MGRVPLTIYLPEDLVNKLRRKVLLSKLQGDSAASVSKLLASVIEAHRDEVLNSTKIPRCFSEYDERDPECRDCPYKQQCKESARGHPH